MKLDERGGFFKQADMEQGLLFAIRARGYEERWRVVQDSCHVVTSSVRRRVATANTCKTSVERASRPHPFFAA